MIQDKNTNSKPLETLGKYGLINHFNSIFSEQNVNSELSLNNVSVIKTEKTTVLNQLMWIENVHFNLGYTPLKHLGYKFIVAGISSIISKNSVAKNVMLSIAVSNRFGVEALEELLEGVKIACKNYEIDLANIDFQSSVKGLQLAVTTIGEVANEALINNQGVQENDLLVVTGDLGAAYFGLQVLERENQVWKSNPNVQPDLSEYNYLIQRQLKPEARTDAIQTLTDLNLNLTSLIDVKEGLATAVLLLSNQHNIDFTIYEDQLPMDPKMISTAEEFQINPATAILNGGEDYELLFTIPLGEQDKIKNNPHFTPIGHATKKNSGNVMIGKGGETQIPISAQGFPE